MVQYFGEQSVTDLTGFIQKLQISNHNKGKKQEMLKMTAGQFTL